MCSLTTNLATTPNKYFTYGGSGIAKQKQHNATVPKNTSSERHKPNGETKTNTKLYSSNNQNTQTQTILQDFFFFKYKKIKVPSKKDQSNPSNCNKKWGIGTVRKTNCVHTESPEIKVSFRHFPLQLCIGILTLLCCLLECLPMTFHGYRIHPMGCNQMLNFIFKFNFLDEEEVAIRPMYLTSQ